MVGVMASWDAVREIALALPQTSERVSRQKLQWRVKDKLFVWERPLRPKEIEELGPGAPSGPILGARVEHLVAKEALLAADPDVYFTTSHFDGYAAILARLEQISTPELEELITEAWLARATGPLVKSYLGKDR